MIQFFQFWPDIAKEVRFPLWGAGHLTLLGLCAVLLIGCIYKTLRLSPDRIRFWVRFAAVCLPILELARILWIMIVGERLWFKLLPLHVCGVHVLFLPWAAYTKRNHPVQEFVFSTGILGGISALLFLSGIADTYPLFHFQTIQSVLYHGIMIYVPVVLAKSGQFQPKIQRLPQALGILLASAMVAAVIDVWYEQNYMFLLYPPLGTPMVALFEQFGRGLYLLCMTILVGLGLSLPYACPLFWKAIPPTKNRT